MGFLNARRETKDDKGKVTYKKSRQDEARDHKVTLPLVPLLAPDAVGYLMDWFLHVGPTMQSGMGDGPLTYQELRAFRLDILDVEASTLRAMSSRYIAGREIGKNTFAISPLNREISAGRLLEDE